MSNYIEPFLNGKRIKKICSLAKTSLGDLKFDTIAVRGVSGLIVGAPLSASLAKDLIVIRKPNDDCHSEEEVEGIRPSQRILIVDDFIDSGTTMERIRSDLSEFINSALGDTESVEIVGILLYSSNRKAKSYKLTGGKVPLFNISPNKSKG